MALERRYSRALTRLPLSAVFLFMFAFAGASEAAAPLRSITLDAGYRVDKFQWNIAGNSAGANPDVLSELTWKGLGIFNLKAAYRSESTEGFCLRGVLDYGFILLGKNQDSDYNGNGRTRESSRSNNRGDGGAVWDASFGVGYKGTLSLRSGTLDVIPMIGYALYQQSLRITDGVQAIPPTGAFSGLDSSYTARWVGPWAGAEAAYKSGKATFTGDIEYHLADYSATANWNLRSDFKHPDSFDHSASGYGIVASAGAHYALSSSLSINGGVEALRFRASNGTDTTHFADGTNGTTKLNGVVWDSIGAMLGVRYRF